MNAKERTGLAKGQLWRLKHVYIYIVELGNRLLEYRMMDSPEERGVRTKTSSIDVMLNYLESRRAQLIKRGGGM
jgi:hypothetical protein